MPLQQRLAEQRLQPAVGNAGEDHVLVGAQPDLAVAVGVSETSGLHQVDPGQPTDRDGAADVGQAGLALGVHAHVVTPVATSELLPGRGEGESGALGELLPETLRPQLLHEVAHPGEATVLPVAELAVELGDRPRDLHHLIGPHEHVDVARHPGAVGETAADEDVEADVAAVAPGGPHPDVVDLGLGAVLEAAGDAHLELAGEVGVLAVAGEEARDPLGVGQSVDRLVGVESGNRAAEDVAGRVAARLDGRQPRLRKAPPDLGDVADPQPVELDVLPGGDVAEALAPQLVDLGPPRQLVGDLAYHPRLGCRAAGHPAP